MAGTFTNENYHMFEPSPIEQVLAPLADSALHPSAALMLSNYQNERRGAQQDYQGQLDKLHQMQAYELMVNHIAARQKLAVEAGQHPGSLPLFIGNPTTADLFAGTDQGAVDQTMQNYRDEKIAPGLLRGAGSAGMAGFIPNMQDLSAKTGINMTQGTAPIVQAAYARNAGDGAKGGPTFTRSITVPPSPDNPEGGTLSAHGKNPAELAAMVPQLRSQFSIVPPARSVTVGSGSGASPPPPTMGAGGSVVPLAQTQANGGGTTVQPLRDTDPAAIQRHKATLASLEGTIKAQHPQAYADLKAALARDGKLTYARDKQGNLYTIGASGRAWQ